MIDIQIKMKKVATTIRVLTVWQHSIAKAIEQSVDAEALLLKTIIQSGIRDQAPGGKPFLPIKPETAERKGSTKALIDKGDLLRSVKVGKVPGNSLARFVGTHRKERNSSGGELYNIMEIHEDGTKDGRIPARPVLKPSWNQWIDGADKRFLEHVAEKSGFNSAIAKGTISGFIGFGG